MISNTLPVNLVGFSMELAAYTKRDIAVWFLLIIVCYGCMISVAGRYDSLSKSSELIRYVKIRKYKMLFVRDISVLIVLVMTINLIVSTIQLQSISFEMVLATIILVLNFLLKSCFLFWIMGMTSPSIAICICFFLETSIFWTGGESLTNVYNWGMLCRDQIYAKSGFHIIYICMIEMIVSVLFVILKKVKR